MRSPTDARLVARVLTRDADAADVLFRRHWPSSWRTALAVCGSYALAEDAAQEGWVRAFTALAQFDRSRPFEPWLRRIVVNCAIDAIGRSPRVTGAVDGERAALPAELDDAVVAAVLRLPVERRVVVALRYWADLSVPAIAESLGIPAGTARSRLARALEELRTMPEVQR